MSKDSVVSLPSRQWSCATLAAGIEDAAKNAGIELSGGKVNIEEAGYRLRFVRVVSSTQVTKIVLKQMQNQRHVSWTY